MTWGLGRRRQAFRSALAAALVVTAVGAVTGCSPTSNSAAPTTTALVITVSPSVVAPSGLLSSSAQAATTEPAQSSVLGPSRPEATTQSVASTESTSVASSEQAPPIPVATSDVVLRDAPSPQEAADRAAVEAQWVKFWEVAAGLSEQPNDQWDSLINEVSVDPMRTSVLESAARRKLANRSNYGTIGHSIFWQFPVDGSSVATIADCQDHSSAGMIDNSTGVNSGPGGARVNVRGVLVRGEDGVWRVREYYELADTPCPSL